MTIPPVSLGFFLLTAFRRRCGLQRIVVISLSMLLAVGQALARDEGRWQILQAHYGTERQNFDVTAQLRETARRDQRVRVTNSLFRHDPAPGSIKVLRIFARDRHGSVRTLDYGEGSWIDGSQFTGWGRGNWGREGWTGTWSADGGRNDSRGSHSDYDGTVAIARAEYGTPQQTVDVTERLRWISRGRELDVRVSNDLAGVDPAPGQQKRLRVYFRAGKSQQQTVDVWEGQQLRLP